MIKNANFFLFFSTFQRYYFLQNFNSLLLKLIKFHRMCNQRLNLISFYRIFVNNATYFLLLNTIYFNGWCISPFSLVFFINLNFYTRHLRFFSKICKFILQIIISLNNSLKIERKTDLSWLFACGNYIRRLPVSRNL